MLLGAAIMGSKGDVRIDFFLKSVQFSGWRESPWPIGRSEEVWITETADLIEGELVGFPYEMVDHPCPPIFLLCPSTDATSTPASKVCHHPARCCTILVRLRQPPSVRVRFHHRGSMRTAEAMPLARLMKPP